MPRLDASWVALLAAIGFLSACAGNGGSGGGQKPPACIPPPPEQRLSFSHNIQPIFDSSCALQGCHTAGTLSGDLDLTAGRSYKQLVGVASSQQPKVKRVAPGKPEDSYLVRKIIGAPGTISGAPMPQGCPIPPPGGSCLSPDNLPAIQLWITQCATNN